MRARFIQNDEIRPRVRSAIVAGACSVVVGGCVAPLLVAGASGAGMFGSFKGMSAIQRHQMASDDRLRSLSAGSIGVSSDDIIAISDKHWRHGVVHWVVTTRNGRRFGCESGTANGSCAPLAS